MKKNPDKIDKKRLPKHVVIIMDGNGRWAERKNLSRITGHREGIKSVSSIVGAGREIGLKYITLFAFSAQNWNRPKKEVLALMEELNANGTTLILITHDQNIADKAHRKIELLDGKIVNDTKGGIIEI